MLTVINKLLLPLENSIQKYRKYIGYAIIFLSICSWGYLAMQGGTKESGSAAMLILWILLWLPIFARVIGLSLARILMSLRKELGILMGTLAVVHAISYIHIDPSMLTTRGFWITGNLPSAYAFGYVAYILTIPLLLTSNLWAMKKLGKHWKTLHRTVYIIIILAVLHVALLRGILHFDYSALAILILYFVAKICEWKGVSLIPKKIYNKGQKWICVPCGMVYDPIFGDTDSGIIAGTEFTDIPADWKCPVCGVSKSDFVPMDADHEQVSHDASIISTKLLNPTTLELIIETMEILESKPGQFVTFLWTDISGPFSRQYSIARVQGNSFTFLIKIRKNSRGGAILSGLNTGAFVQIAGVFGNFHTMDTPVPKVFVATGTGLAPIYNMICVLPDSVVRSLYFSVSTEAELFYLDKLREISHLDLHVHVTREVVAGCENGRLDIDQIVASPDTEWYFCGAPDMVIAGKEKLIARGFTKIYSEEF